MFLQPLAELEPDKNDSRFRCRYRSAAALAAAAEQHFQGLAFGRGNFTDPGAARHQRRNQLQMLQVGLGILAPSGRRLVTGSQPVAALPHPQRIRLETGKSGNGANTVEGAGFHNSLIHVQSLDSLSDLLRCGGLTG